MYIFHCFCMGYRNSDWYLRTKLRRLNQYINGKVVLNKDRLNSLLKINPTDWIIWPNKSAIKITTRYFSLLAKFLFLYHYVWLKAMYVKSFKIILRNDA